MKTIRIISHKKYYNNKFIFKILSYNCATLNHRIKSQYHIFNLEDAHTHKTHGQNRQPTPTQFLFRFRYALRPPYQKSRLFSRFCETKPFQMNAPIFGKCK